MLDFPTVVAVIFCGVGFFLLGMHIDKLKSKK